MIKNFCFLKSDVQKTDFKPNLKKDSYVLFLVGKPGSGKTSLIMEILLNDDLCKGIYDYVFIFSPTKLSGIDCILNENWYTTLDFTIISDILANINSRIQENKKQVRVLFIIDDLVALLRKYKNTQEMMELFYNRRHLIINNSEISYILTSQRYIAMPSNFRTCITDLIIFRLNDKDYKSIKEDSVGYLNIKDINNYLINDHDFLYISLSTGEIYKNFLQKI